MTTPGIKPLEAKALAIFDVASQPKRIRGKHELHSKWSWHSVNICRCR